jgi:hypothetical protein
MDFRGYGGNGNSTLSVQGGSENISWMRDGDEQNPARAKTYGGINLKRQSIAGPGHARFGELRLASFRGSMTKRAKEDVP